MPLSLLYEWMAFNRLEPFGYEVEHQRWRISEYRAFLRNGMLMAGLINLWTGKRARKFKADDFIPESVRPNPPAPITQQTKTDSEIYGLFKTALGLIGIKPKKKVTDADV